MRTPCPRPAKDEAGLVHAGEHHHAKIRAECLDRKVRVVAALVRRAEDGDELTREALGQDERDGADDRLAEQELCKEFTHARLFPRAHVVTYDGNAARRHADDDGNDDLEELHHNADDGHRDLRVLLLREYLIQRAVLAQHVVDGRHRRDKANL